jgi:hypothetical protein
MNRVPEKEFVVNVFNIIGAWENSLRAFSPMMLKKLMIVRLEDLLKLIKREDVGNNL